ncbi:MAG: hypothetical protein KIT31_18570 [Deltaproteobacteria bacterium]|nr:hypothetical protein [Deltaproteobacteria bacterium]
MTMHSLEGIALELSHAPAEFKHVRDVEFFDGPLVTEFVADEEPYLFIWRDRDSRYHRWLAIKVTTRDVALYEAGRATLYGLIERSTSGYLVDVDAQGAFTHWYAIAFEHLPDEYRPEPDSFFDPKLSPKPCAREH